MENSNSFIDIIILAVVTGLLIWRLRSALGRRTGNERQHPLGQPRQGDVNSAQGNDNVISLPGRTQEDFQEDAEQQKATMAQFAPEGSELSEKLLELQSVDRSFTAGEFLSGAKMAYEMIVTSFASNDRETLRPLLAADVFEKFDQVMTEREEKDMTVETEFVGVQSADFVKASLRDRISEVTVKFISELVSVTKNADGAVIEGDPTRIKKVTDVWTFMRDVTNPDPNWKLIRTEAEAKPVA